MMCQLVICHFLKNKLDPRGLVALLIKYHSPIHKNRIAITLST